MTGSNIEGGGPTTEHASLLRMVYGAQAAQVIYVAAKLAVPAAIERIASHDRIEV